MEQPAVEVRHDVERHVVDLVSRQCRVIEPFDVAVDA